MKTIKQAVAEYVNLRIADGTTSISVAEIQRNFSLGFVNAREILDTMPNLIFNPCCYRYSVFEGVK